ncbi:MAG: DUF1015 domain-containing protein [Myxococcota bacterium]|nr:DUF1015 domain-containing protein [Myxococcota bacterium]
MTDVTPFRALRYDPARVDLSQVMVPPYDVVTREDRLTLWDRDPHSAARITLTRDPDDEAVTDYQEAAETLARWRREEVLQADAEPGFYVLRQRFVDPGGEARERLGFFGALRLEDYAARVVRPHERTLSGPKADRLKILRATRVNLSPIFLLYEDPQQELAGLLEEALGAERVSARSADGIDHELARLGQADAVARLRGFLEARAVVIADGHHRYETALAYRDERRAGEPGAGADAPFELALGYFANAYAPGSLLLPIHRVVREVPAPDDAAWAERLPGWECERVPLPGPEAVPELLAKHLTPLAARHAFAADDGSGVLRVFQRAADEELTIRVIHREVLGGVFELDDAAVRDGAVAFPKHAEESARDVRAGGGTVALYLNPLTPEDVFRVTGAGEILPQKSTFFLPKLPSGLVFRPLDESGA